MIGIWITRIGISDIVMHYRKLVKQEVYRYLVIRMSKDSEKYEVVFSSTKHPYWRKSLTTVDELAAEEKFVMWSNHALLLQFLPAKLCYYAVI